MASVLLVSPDRIASELAGPGIRCLELGRVLASTHDVVVAAPPGSNAMEGGPELAVYDPARPRTLARVLHRRDVVIAPPLTPSMLAGATRRGRIWIVDLYNPEPFEGLEDQKGRPPLEQRVRDVTRIDRIGYAARLGTAFICASERQRDMWLGFLAASRRLSARLYAKDPELRTLIDVVPFGIPDEPPVRADPPALRGTLVPGDARVLLWNGGLWDWVDPLTPIRAVAFLRAEDPRWTLVFSAVSHPDRRPTPTAEAALRVADELGLRESGGVHFARRWTPYAERGSLLLEADIGVSTHHAGAEARFAHRARLFDFLWGRLPILCTEGDEWASVVDDENLGESVPPADAGALAAAAARIAARGRDSYEPALAAAAAQATWSQAAAPLLRLIDELKGARPRPRSLRARALSLRYSAARLGRRRRPDLLS
jgi:hypothetical protein